MLYFWLRSDDLAEDRTSVDMLSVGPVDVLPDAPVLAAAMGPTGTGIVAPGGGAVGAGAPAVAAAVIKDGAVAIATALFTYCR